MKAHTAQVSATIYHCFHKKHCISAMLCQLPPEAQQQTYIPTCSQSASVIHLTRSSTQESVQKHSCLTHLFHQSHISLPSIADQCKVLAPASGHFFHFSLAYHSSVLNTTKQERDLPSEFLTATYFRGVHKHPNLPRHQPPLTHEG